MLTVVYFSHLLLVFRCFHSISHCRKGKTAYVSGDESRVSETSFAFLLLLIVCTLSSLEKQKKLAKEISPIYKYRIKKISRKQLLLMMLFLTLYRLGVCVFA